MFHGQGPALPLLTGGYRAGASPAPTIPTEHPILLARWKQALSVRALSIPYRGYASCRLSQLSRYR